MGQKLKGFSSKSNERSQRLSGKLGKQSARGVADQIAFSNYFLGGGPFQQGSFKDGSGGTIRGNVSSPQGDLFQLVDQGLRSELGLSQGRQDLAAQLLGNSASEIGQSHAFGSEALDAARTAIPIQQLLRNAGIGTFAGDFGLNQQVTGDLANFFASGGAPNQFQGQTINDIYGAQRDIGASNLQQQFDGFMRQATDSFSDRGLRATDTPSQEMLDRGIDEFNRNAQNFETGLSGQEAAAMLNVPF